MLLAHKIALDPNAAQRVYFARAAGTARFAWNWALRRWREEYALKCEYRCGPAP
jgi:putative transposase